MKLATMTTCLLCFGLLVAGCARARQPEVTQAAPMPRNDSIELGRSVNGELITMRLFGDGEIGVLILGGIHGDETNSVEVTTRLIELLSREPQLAAGRKVGVIRVANPDGYAARTRVNANGVDLNRNFPATNFRATRRFGASPADQPETRAILAAIERINPSLVISIHCMHRQTPCNNFDGPAQEVAELMRSYNGYRVAPTMGYPTPGSMGSLVGIDRRIPIITLELPATADPPAVWEKNRDALVAVIRAAVCEVQ